MPGELPGPLPIHAHDGLQQSQKRVAQPWVPDVVAASPSHDAEPELPPELLDDPLLEPLELEVEAPLDAPPELLLPDEAADPTLLLPAVDCDPDRLLLSFPDEALASTP